MAKSKQGEEDLPVGVAKKNKMNLEHFFCATIQVSAQSMWGTFRNNIVASLKGLSLIKLWII